jgi:4-alpha-glucanotransferase
VGLNLDDLVGESEPVNLPGVAPDRYPSWTRKLAMPVEALDSEPVVRTALEGVRRGVP